MRPVILVMALVFNISTAFGKGANPFDLWDTCPKNQSELKTELDKLDGVMDLFAGLKGDEKMKVLDGSDWRAVYLEHLGAFLLPSNIRSDVAKSCWAFYEDIRRAVGASDGKLYKESVVAWQSCLKVKYGNIPSELQKLLGCFEKVSWHK